LTVRTKATAAVVAVTLALFGWSAVDGGRALASEVGTTLPARVVDDWWSVPTGPIARDAAVPTDARSLPAALVRAEFAFQAGQSREALEALDVGPIPGDVLDLAALRRAELAFNLGDTARARAELGRPELVGSANRILLVRAAQLADRLGDNSAAAELWLRSTRYFSWVPERGTALTNAALNFARLGQADRAADALARLADLGAEVPFLSAELAPVAKLGEYHAGLVAAIVGDKQAAAQHFRRYLAERPTGDFAAAARRRLTTVGRPAVDLAWIDARDTDTVASYRAWAAAFPNDPRVPDAVFFEGLVSYRAGQYQGALQVWSPWTTPNVEAEARARAIYWSGRAHEALGQPEAARASWQQASALKPMSFYTMRAGDRLNGIVGWPDAGGELRAPAPTPAEEAEVDAWLAGWAGPARDPAPADAAALRRASLFAGLGLGRTAEAELHRLIESTEDPRALYAAGRLARETGSWMESLRAGLRLAAMSPPKVSADAPVGVRLLSYPMAYGDEVQSASARVGIGPIFLLSLMRQESLFDRFAHSAAEARGLTQVIPETGAKVARELGRTRFQPEELFDPKQSIAFGSHYIAGRVKLFGGDVFRAVAAYNAGAEAVAKWAPGSDDPDLFVEAIDYRETRGYVKSIYEYQAIYRGLVRPAA
jgi:soluble lytic murein transglycosylase-like protein